MRKYYVRSILLLSFFICYFINVYGQDGPALFRQTCAACHMFGEKLVGPDLLGVNEKRSEEWLIKFIKSSQSMIKAGDPEAVAIFEEYNQVVMLDQPGMDDNQIRTILAYIKDETQARQGTESSNESVVAERIPIDYSQLDIDTGLLLFSGQLDFVNHGPSCMSCHDVDEDKLLSGGLLAKDLTHVYGRMGDVGIASILGTPPFPSMATTYENNGLDSTEIAQLTAFLKDVDQSTEEEAKASEGNNIFFLGGSGGLILLFLLFGLHWKNRMKSSTKHDIYKRQTKSE